MKRLILLLITLLTFTNVSFSQSELSVDAGLTTEYGANLLAINYNLSLSRKHELACNYWASDLFFRLYLSD
ncbi:hypothetical protein N9K38_00540 [Flavobacteriales bacterium]|nr:hypothetical protein [Flavobacteriales bacterium]